MRPSRVRYGVVGFAVSLAFVMYLDRICIAQLNGPMSGDLGLTKSEMGFVFGAFTLAYSIFEIPTGWLGDLMGPRKVLLRIVLWWSFFTAATGMVWNWISLLIVRFLFGAGEAGCFPNLTKAFTVWLTHSERVRAQGILWMAARWGGAVTPLVVATLMQNGLTWRHIFGVFGMVGTVWAVFFYLWFRDHPSEHKGVNAAELELLKESSKLASGHGNVPWGKFASSPSVWLLWFQYFCLSYGWYFYVTWLPKYLQEARHMELMKGAVLAGIPLFLGGIGCFFSGMISPWLAAKMGSVTKARRLMACVGFVGASGLLFYSIYIEDPVIAMIVMGGASFMNDLVMPGAWGACMDLGGKYAGTLSGSMNMMGNFAGVVAPIAIGGILDMTNNNWSIPFYISAGVYLLGAVAWLFIDPVRRLDQEESHVESAV